MKRSCFRCTCVVKRVTESLIREHSVCRMLSRSASRVIWSAPLLSKHCRCWQSVALAFGAELALLGPTSPFSFILVVHYLFFSPPVPAQSPYARLIHPPPSACDSLPLTQSTTPWGCLAHASVRTHALARTYIHAHMHMRVGYYCLHASIHAYTYVCMTYACMRCGYLFRCYAATSRSGLPTMGLCRPRAVKTQSQAQVSLR